MSAKGGITKGKSHAEGGIPMVVESTGQQVELEGGEGVINKRNMASTKTFDFEGKKMTICEIASKINSSDGNGVQIDCDNVTGTKYKYAKGGKILNEDEEESFKEWMDDGNVISFEKDVYSTQDAQYRNRLKGMDELRKYFRKEFLSDSYSEGGNVNEELKMDYDFRSLLLPNEKQFFLQNETKGIEHKGLIIFTDGKREIVFSRYKTKLKKLGNASNSTKALYDKYFADGGYVDLETYNFNELRGKYVNLYSMGVELPTENQIVDVTLSSPQFRYRYLTLKFDRGNAQIKFNDIEDFLNEEIVYVKTDKEEFGVQLIPNQFAKGGRTKNAMKLDDYENASVSMDSYEDGAIASNPTEFANGGGVDSQREYLEKRLWNERGYDYAYLNKLSVKELRSLYDTEFYYDEEFKQGGVVDEIKTKYQIAGSDKYGVYTYSKRVADEIANMYGGDVQEDGSKWYVRLDETYEGGGGVGNVYIALSKTKNGLLLSERFDKQITHKQLFDYYKKKGYEIIDSNIFKVTNKGVLDVFKDAISKFIKEKYNELVDWQNTLLSYEIVGDRIIAQSCFVQTKNGNEYKITPNDLVNKKFAKGGGVDLPKANKMFHLPLELAVYVPSTQDVDKVISDSELKERVDEVSEYLARLFGGFTKSDKIGGFMSSKSELVTEDVVPVVSFATKDDFNANKDKLVNKLSEWAKRWGQEAIGFEFEGDLYYVPESFGNGGNIKKIKYGNMTKHKYAEGGRVRYYLNGFEESLNYILNSTNGKEVRREGSKENGDLVIYFETTDEEYAQGGGIKHSYEITQEGNEFIVEFLKSNGELDWGRGGFSSREEAEKYALENRRYAKGGGVDGKMAFYRGWADVNYFDEEGEYKKYHTYNHIKAESQEKAKMIFLRHLENKIGQNEWEWAEEEIYINPAQDSDETIEFRGYLSASDFGGLTKDKFSKGRFAKGGGVKSKYAIVFKEEDGSELIQYTDAYNLMDATKQAKLVSDILNKKVKNVYLADDEEDMQKYRSQAKRIMKRMGYADGGGVGHPIIDVSGGINVGKYVVRGYDGKSAEYSLNKKGLKAKNSDDVAYFNSDEADKFIEANRSKYLRLQKHRIRERTFNDDVADYDDFVDRQTNIRGKEYVNGGGVSGEKVFEAQEDGIIGISAGSDAYTMEISKGDKFVTYGNQDDKYWWIVKMVDKKPRMMQQVNRFDYDENKSRVNVNTNDLILTFPKGDKSIYAEFKEVFAKGGGVGQLTNGQKNQMYLESLPFELHKKYLENIAKHYGVTLEVIKREVYHDDAEMLYEYIADRNLRAIVYVGMESMQDKFGGGGDVRDFSWYQDFKKQELKRGTEHEMEHIESIKKFKKKGVSDREVAKAIAKDHLDENENYYIELEKMQESSEKVSNALQDFEHQKSKRKSSRKYKLGGYMGDNKSVNVHIKLTKDHEAVVRSKDGTYLNDVNLKKDKVYKFGFLFDEGQNVAFDLGDSSDSYMLIPSNIVVVVGYDEEKMELGGEVKSYADYNLDRNDKSILKLLLNINPRNATAEQRDKVSTFKGNNIVNDLSPKLIQKIYGILFQNHNVDNKILNLYITNIGVGNIVMYAPSYLHKTMVGFDEKNQFVQVEKEIANIVTEGKRRFLFNEFELSDMDGFIHVYPKSNPEVDTLCGIFYKTKKKAVAVGVCEFTSREKLDAFQRSIGINQGSMALNQMISFAKSNDYLIVNEGITSEGAYTLIYTMTKY